MMFDRLSEFKTEDILIRHFTEYKVYQTEYIFPEALGN
jgi:hypothetical protein